MNYNIETRKEVIKKVKAMRKKGMSDKEIADIIEIPVTTFRDWVNYGPDPKKPSVKDVKSLRERGFSVIEIAKKLKTYPQNVRSVIRKIDKELLANVSDTTNTNEETSDTPIGINSQQTFSDGTSILTRTFNKEEFSSTMTPSELLEIFGLSASDWEITHSKFNTWNGMTSPDAEGKNGKMDLYQVSITVKPLKYGTVSYADVKRFFEENKFIRETEKIKINPVKNGYILNIPLADWHYNLLASKSTSGEVYNCEIAKNLLEAAIARIIQNVKGMPISKISFVTLGDVFHTDNSKQTTTKGTQQQVEKPCNEAYRDVLKIIRKVINTLVDELNAPLEYIYIHGNHDKDTGDDFAASIEALYEGHENITTDCSPLPFKCRMYGNTLVGYHHGDANANNLSAYLPNEERELYGKAKKAVMKVGHLHHYAYNAKGVVPIENQPALCGSSAWEKQQGFCSERGIRYTLYSNNSTSCIDGFVSVDDIKNDITAE